MATPQVSLSSVKKAGWRLSADSKAIVRDYVLKDFVAAIQLMRRIAKISEELDHHPDLHLTAYRRLRIVLSTHVLGTHSWKDYQLASQIDRLPKLLKINRL